MNSTEPKIIGLITAWGAEDWIESAIRQALDYCHEVIVSVSVHVPALVKFQDATLDICRKFPEITLMSENISDGCISRGRCKTLNRMLAKSRLYFPGNWIWMMDVDEFYTESGYKEIKAAIESNQYDYIEVEEKFFFINMHRYLKGSHGRLWKIKWKNLAPFYRFKPTNKWKGSRKSIYTLPRRDGMFHYSMLVNPEYKKAQWHSEFDDTAQTHKTRWLKKIYLNYDLENEDFWINKNLEVSGIKSPWFNSGFQPDESGRLFSYVGSHPKLIQDAALNNISDFRIKYATN